MKRTFIILALVAVTLVVIKLTVDQSESITAIDSGHDPDNDLIIANSNAAENTTTTNQSESAVATFAGGCFWCIEATFEKLQGVRKAVSGYSGGHTDFPTYQDVGGGSTGHTEAVQIFYDPNVISYEALLHQFWRDIDPTDSEGQFIDRGSEYRPAIFYRNETEKEIAIKARDELEATNQYSKPITIEIVPFDKFYDAESYHQDYYKKSPGRYKLYRHGSGRDQYLEKIWGDQLKDKYDEKTSAVGLPYRIHLGVV